MMLRNLLLPAIIWIGCLGAANSAPPNVLLICVDDLRPELGCFGVPYIQSPNIDRLAAHGRAFQRHYVQAPTCGASRYALLTGLYGPAGNDALMRRGQTLLDRSATVAPSMPAWFRQHGYTTVSIGKVSHHPGGLAGKNWNDPSKPEMPVSWDRHLLPAGKWQHPEGWMHGLANGEIRRDASKMDVFQSVDGPDAIYPDGGSVDEAVRQLQTLTGEDDQPFFLAVGILRPHLPFGAPAKYLEPYRDLELPPIPHPMKPSGKTTWHRSGEFMKYNRWGRDPNTDREFATEVRRHYAACVSYADAQVGRLVETLNSSGKSNQTIIVLWGDHGWHLGEHGIWGKHALFEESLRSPLIIYSPGMKQTGASSSAVVETVDVFPTLCDLAGLPDPNLVDGVSLRPLLDDPNASGHPAISYHHRASTVRTDRYRLIVHQNEQLELYDHESRDGETVNLADQHPAIVQNLRETLEQRLSRRGD